MAFPDDRLPRRLELAFGADPAGDPGTWAWTDVSGDVHRQDITIRRGRSDEASQVVPTSAALTLDNPNGDYTPDHPMGAHYPLVRQGVPARLSVQAGGPHLRVPDVTGSRARVASSTALNVTSDLDVRVELALDRLPAQWGATPPSGNTAYAHAAQEIVGRYVPSGTDRMWRVLMAASGAPSLQWSTDGATVSTASLTDPVPFVSGQRFAFRVTLDVNDGAGGHVARFYVADSIAGPWRQLGPDQPGSGTTSIYQGGSAPLDVADITLLAFPLGAGRYYRVQLRDGIDGPLLADADFTAQAVGATSWTDSAGRLWEVQGQAEITDWRRRAVGTVDEWAPHWPYGDLSDGDAPEDQPGEARTGITISGILRRLGQGAKPLQSTLRRKIPSDSRTLAYWPGEDGPEATSIASGLPGGPPATFSGLDMAAESGLVSSAPLPQLGQAGGSFRAPLPGVPDPSLGWRAEMVYYLDEMPATSLGWFRVATSGGGVARVTGYIGASEARIRLHDAEGAIVGEFATTDSTALAVATSGWARVRIMAQPSGGSWEYRLRWTPIGSDETWSVFVTHSGYTQPTKIDCVWPSGLAGMPIGHITYVNDPVAISVYGDGTGAADDAHRGEGAIARMRRLAEEERLPLSVSGDSAQSPTMGPQQQATLLELLLEAVDADGGLLAERREVPGVQYRPRYLLYNQRPALTLDAHGNEIDHPFTPVLDDQRLRNEWIISRPDGSSATAVDEDSIAARGLYDDSATVNVENDDQLDPIAYWRLHRGTWPGMRYPAVTTALDLAPQTIDAWLDRAEGDRIQVMDLPPQHPSDTVDLMIEGLTETISPTRWTMEAATSPYGPWSVGEAAAVTPGEETGPTHVDTDGTVLYGAADADDTALDVAATVGPDWATTAGPAPTGVASDLPVDVRIAGEVMTVTSIQPRAWDTFTRTVSNSWGTSTSGHTWTGAGGSSSERSVNGSQGIITLSSTPTNLRAEQQLISLADCELLVTITPSQLAAGAALLPGILLRAATDYYSCRLVLGTGGTVGMEVTRSGILVGTTATTPYTYAAGTALRLRARVDGHQVRGRVWPASSMEPAVWHVDRTIATGTIASGAVGVIVLAASGNTNASPQFSWDDFEIVRPQRWTVTRSVNGISKSHAAAADVRLAHPAIVSL